MDDTRLQELDWYPELLEYVRQALRQSAEHQHNQRPSLQHELKTLQAKKKGWSESLAKPDLNASIRVALEAEWAEVIAREQQIEVTLQELNGRDQLVEELVDPGEILNRLNRLGDILAANNPTMGNLELSLHIDRVDCYQDGKVILRTCKLGALTGAVDLLADKPSGDNRERHGGDENAHQGKPRRRARLRVEDLDGSYPELRDAADMAADPDRFAGLPDDWFWEDVFQIPDRRPSWVVENAEMVFQRRQEGNLSHSRLADEFGVSKPTIATAIKHHLATHPDEKDEVHCASGGARPPKFDIENFCEEARQLWESGWSKLKLADKYGCSTPIIDKALAHAYEQAELPMPTRKDRQNMKCAEARQMLDAGRSLDEIAAALKVSDVTARQCLKASFAAEGKAMPDLRSHRGKQ